MKRLPPWFREFLARYKRAVAVAIGLGLVASGGAALLMFTSGYLVSATALAGTTLFSIMIPVAFVQLFGFGRPFARYAERLASHDWVLHVTSDLRLMLFRAADERTGDPARQRSLGEYLGLLADDVAHLQNLYLRVVFPTVIAYLLALGAALLFGFFSVPCALIVALALVVVVVGLPLACLLATRMSSMRAKAAKAQEYATLSDDVYGAIDWVLAGRGDDARTAHARADAAVRASEATARLVERSFTFASTVLLVVVLCGVIVWAGTTFGQPGANVNWIAAFALGFFPIMESFIMLPSAMASSTAQLHAVHRIDDLIGSGETGAPALPDGISAGESKVAESPQAALAFHDVSYRYPGARRCALDGLNLTVRSGEAVAVLGRSGAGKSTFARLACGQLTPDEGTVEALGCDLNDPACDPSRLVGFVGQVPYLFNRTLRDNLTMGARDVPDAALFDVLRSIGLQSKFDALADGLDTVVGETGVGFSGGEAHRVALARVLVANTPVVIVDEPFSALDPETERDLLATMIEACADRTLVVITHHLAEIERFDRVVFIEDGRVDLDGAPADLLRDSQRFRELVKFDRNTV